MDWRARVGERLRSVLLWAFVLSLVIHVAVTLLAARLPKAREVARDDTIPLSLETAAPRRTIIPPPPTPRPTPPPRDVQRPTVPQHPRPIHLPSVIVRHTRTASGAGPVTLFPSSAPGAANGGDGTPAPATSAPMPAATPSPAPTATPKPACAQPDTAARVVQAAQPETPDGALSSTTQARVEVRVDLSDSGRVLGASVYASSGDMQLDAAAVAAARRSEYAPAVTSCVRQPGSYKFVVEFDR
jgi:TonB family protein